MDPPPPVPVDDLTEVTTSRITSASSFSSSSSTRSWLLPPSRPVLVNGNLGMALLLAAAEYRPLFSNKRLRLENKRAMSPNVWGPAATPGV